MQAKRGRSGVARGRVGLHRESDSVPRSGVTPTGGPRLSVGCGRGRPGRAGPEGEGGPAGEVWPAREKGKRKERLGWAGIKGEKERERKERLCIFFEIDSNNSIQIQIQRIQIQIEQQAIKQCNSA